MDTFNIFEGFTRGNPDKKGTKLTGECFANSEEFAAKCAFNGTQVGVGAYRNKLLGLFTQMGLITIGASGTGKSVGLDSYLAHYKGSIFVLDPKLGRGENLALWRSIVLKDDVFILSVGIKVRENLQPFLAYWDLLGRFTLDNETLLEDIGLIGEACIIGKPNGETHWTDSAQTFFEGIVAHVVSCPLYRDKKDLITVSQLVSKGATVQQKDGKDLIGMEGLVFEMLQNAELLKARHEELAEFIEAGAMDFWERADKERGSVLSTLRTQLKFLKYKSVREVLRYQPGKKKLGDLADLKIKKMSIFLSIPAGKLTLFNRLLRLAVNMTLEAVERETTVPEVASLLVIDEWPVISYLRSLEVAAGFVRSFHLKLHLLAQNLGQIKSMHPDSWETFLGNNVVQLFGNSDMETLSYAEKRLGLTPVRLIKRTISTNKVIGDEQISEEMHPLLTAQEASRLLGREDPLARQLILIPSYDPIVCQRIQWYRKDAIYHQKYFSRFCKFLEENNK